MNQSTRMTVYGLLIMSAMLGAAFSLQAAQDSSQDGAAAFIQEIKSKGWIIYCARSDNGSWDLFASRPDGSQRRHITNTPDFEEAAPQLLRHKKVIVYEFVERDIRFGMEGWRRVSLKTEQASG